MSSPTKLAKQLKELNIKRSSVKGQITKFKNFVSNVSQNRDLTSLELAELSVKLSRFEALSLRFDDLQSQIEVLNSDNLQSEIDERENIEHEFVVNIAASKKIVDDYNKNSQQLDSSFHEASAHYNTEYAETCQVGFKLPQIQISKFNGTYFHWLEFHDTFESLIHKNSRIPDIHKFHYLVSYLEGEAARIISNLEISSANYLEAWKLLCDRYNNKRLLTNHHLNSLLNVQPLARESEKSLRFLVDHMTKNLRALSSLGQPTDKWDMLLIFMFSSKLDSQTLTKWEEYRNTLEDMPNLHNFKQFLINRADVLEAINRNNYSYNVSDKKTPTSTRNSHAQNTQNKNAKFTPHTKSFATTNSERTSVFVCIVCGDNHKIYDCAVFKAKSVQEKFNDVKKFKLCSNCLRQGHPLNECRMGPCRECKKRHNTLLHDPTMTANKAPNSIESNITVNCSTDNEQQVLLSTALIEICNPVTKATTKVRALLDSGSQSSFISSSLKNKLTLNSSHLDNLRVIGIGNSNCNTVTESCIIQINALNTPFSVKLSCLVLNELTSEIPKTRIDIKSLKLPSSIILADPTFYQPSKVDVLIGADLFWDIIGAEQRNLGPNLPKLHDSKFGWLISGPMYTKINNNYSIQCNHASVVQNADDDIHNMLLMFWSLEEIPQKPKLSDKDKYCEKHFLLNTTRLENGRFRVKLPLIDTPDCLGDTYAVAKRRFINLEKRFKRNPVLKAEYSKFINEYEMLGHLSESKVKPDTCYFLCHHAVLKETSESTKLRVVFDGSAPSSSGYSLNDILLSGPNIQDSLFSILVRARQYKYLLTGDIEKMYRQVEVTESDRNLQLILWRERESEPIKMLKLNTLTYGTASASYLSTRCIYQLGEDCEDDLIKNIIKSDFYVDDLITGCNDEIQLRYIQNKISTVLSSGCFNLRKYKSNLPNLFNDSNLVNTQESLVFSESSSTLGLGWNPANDTLHFPTKDIPQNTVITKRLILSQSFKIFDPLGILSPFIIIPKIILQQLWVHKLDWDHPVPKDIEMSWNNFQSNVPCLLNLHIPRLSLIDEAVEIEMHSFSDASQHAYGACVYMRSINSSGAVTVRLLCAKSRVAPVKPTTIPRLELCAALLAARLCNSVTGALKYSPERIVHWCDSSIVLAWIRKDPNKLKTFVANRIIEITELTVPSSWRYVPTSQNPADLISRGVNGNQLVSMNLWWHGPDFLSKPELDWPELNSNKIDDLPEIKSNITNISEPIIKFENFSKLNKLIRTFAFVKRFVNNIKPSQNKLIGTLSLEELNSSFYTLCAYAQRESFQIEYDALVKCKPVPAKCRILSLSPFLDPDNNIIRVGGRLNESDYSYEKRHPVLLHASHHLTKLFFEQKHIHNMHAGPQLLLAVVRETMWPINGRRLARRVVNNCVRCKRIAGKTLAPKMGNLPVQRITPDHPFLSVGVDYAGPFLILNRRGRGSQLIKCYLCLFVCLRYKCVHLEAVSDLSKDAFLMTFRRFIARRGKPLEVFSDNGRNFVAAAKEIGQFLRQISEPILDFASQENIKFIFSPAYAPHFGGIFEAGIKSAKYHVKRILGNSHITFEEITTLFAQVEAILNSRPLYPLSSSPNDFLPLSPGHFLIGRPLVSLPSPNLLSCKENTLRRYERLEKLRQHFWNRWQQEYIVELQQRIKWKTSVDQLKVGDMVLIQEENVPPMNWRLGRVTKLFYGKDGISRVADVNTSRGCVRRALVRLCPLTAPEADDQLG
ncbi:uncharacterized protein LOC128679591 [Plodia interpunctella]|uniref:uncharacterized protein LOC128679591 n=1 Tax=Plodia interpunctella TaxID=58824 RepID=UPI002367F63D|nr:uncharacterized protein LOC128679591 [Plodia interpunctella]